MQSGEYIDVGELQMFCIYQPLTQSTSLNSEINYCGKNILNKYGKKILSEGSIYYDKKKN